MSSRGIEGAVFHTGELAAQMRAGVAVNFEAEASKFIRPYFLQQHQTFYQQLPFIVIGACDEKRRPWASVLTGERGFVVAQDEYHLSINSRLIVGDALESALVAGASVGLLGIEFDTKRRNRANGQLTNTSHENIQFKVKHSYGNCPQYISARNGQLIANRKGGKIERACRLTQAMQAWLSGTDSLFIATSNGQAALENSCTQDLGKSLDEVDASHRGGVPGFVKVISDTKIVLADYRGNNFFNSIGNLLLNPKIGLLLIDYKTSSQLQITGTARVDWNTPDQLVFPSAQRLIEIVVDEIIMISAE